MEYIGENLVFGQIGHFFVVLAFVSALIAGIAYAFGVKENAPADWKKIGRTAFAIHGFSILSVIGMIFFLMVSKRYEYSYVFSHVSDDLPMQYIFSAFWEGQEGSFLLWMFWHVVLGFILLFKAKEWEAPVLSILAFIQFIITSMLLGIYLGGIDPMRIGVSPFALLRNTLEAPIFNSATYLQSIPSMANGLNPLLQNYWMTIHPPVIFLGFASLTIPMCYAVAGLWTGKHKAWLKAVLPWALFSGAILGTGILMGGAWAYVALTFGGYWAWDPVENMSLVPWIILVAGIHTNLVAKATGQAIKSTYIYYSLAYALIVYSTFLTRSGVLGDTSVHAFTEMGLEAQLLLFLGLSFIVPFFFIIKNWNKIPEPAKEEASSSKEFWMFIGSLVLLFSAVLITFTTSIPVYNKIAALFVSDFQDIAPPTDPIAHYNKFQLWIAVLIGTLSGLVQFLRFKERNFSAIAKKVGIYAGASILIALVLSFTIVQMNWINANAWQYFLLLTTAIFTIICNVTYLFTGLNKQLKLAGSVFSHLGFGLMIIGVMASGLNKQFISKDTFLGKDLLDQPEKNVFLIKNNPTIMSGYKVTYTRDSFINSTVRQYELDFQKLDRNGKITDHFQLYPNIQYDRKSGKQAASNPSTRHYLNKDIYSHIYLPPSEADPLEAQKAEDSLVYVDYTRAIGDTLFTKRAFGIIESITYQPKHPDYVPAMGDIALGLNIAFRQLDTDTTYYARPMAVVRGNRIIRFHDMINSLNTKIKIGDDIFERVMTTEEELDYKNYTLKQGDKITIDNIPITFLSFNQNAQHAAYKAEDGDIAVGARLQIGEVEPQFAQPVFLIRGSKPYNFKEEVKDKGLHFRFTKINPKSETIALSIAKTAPKVEKIRIELAEDALRSDYVVLEAIVFPGINWFWIGSIMMLFGLFFSMLRRRLQ